MDVDATMFPFLGGGGKGGVRASGLGLEGGSAPLLASGGGVRVRDLEGGGGGV